MEKDESKGNSDKSNIEEKTNKIEDVVSTYRTEILQRYFGAKGGKTLLYSIIVICLGRGLIGKFVFHQTFLYSFSYPLIIVGVVSVLYITIKLISFKSTKAAQIISGTLLVVCSIFLILVFLLLIILILNKFLHFWF
jgi:hypothetical protein